jgi:hypothetical protein
MHYNVHCYSCLSSDNTNTYSMILSTQTHGCVILNVHISLGFKYHEYYPERCLTGNYIFSSEHEITDISNYIFIPVFGAAAVPITTNVASSKPVHGEVYSVQQYVIKFVSDLRQVGGFLWVLRFPPPIKLTTTI